MARFEIDYSLWPEHARPSRRWASLRSVMGAFATGGVVTVAGLAVLSHMTISPAARAETEAARIAAERSRIQVADTDRAVPLKLTTAAKAETSAKLVAVASTTDGRAFAPAPRTERVVTAPSIPSPAPIASTDVAPATRNVKTAAVVPQQATETPVIVNDVSEPKSSDVKPVDAKAKPVKRVAKKTDSFNSNAANAYASTDGRAASPSQRQDQMWRRMSEERSRPSAYPFAPFGIQRF